MTLETDLQVFLYNHNEVKEFKKNLTEVFSKKEVANLVQVNQKKAKEKNPDDINLAR